MLDLTKESDFLFFLKKVDILKEKIFISYLGKMLQSKAHLDQHQNLISSSNTLKDLSEVLANAKKDIFSILKSEVVDAEQDITAINTLATTLKSKKATLEQDFGKSNGLELTDDTQISGILG